MLPANNPNFRLILALYGWTSVANPYDNLNDKKIYKRCRSVHQTTAGSPYWKARDKVLNAKIGDVAVKKWAQGQYAWAAFPLPLQGQLNQYNQRYHFAATQSAQLKAHNLSIVGDFVVSRGCSSAIHICKWFFVIVNVSSAKKSRSISKLLKVTKSFLWESGNWNDTEHIFFEMLVF